MEDASKKSLRTIEAFKLLNQQSSDLARNASAASVALGSVRTVTQEPASVVDAERQQRFLEQVQRNNRAAVTGLVQDSRPQPQLPAPAGVVPKPPVQFSQALPSVVDQAALIHAERAQHQREVQAQNRARMMLLEARATDAQAHPASLTIAGGAEPPKIVGLDHVLRDLDTALVSRVGQIIQSFGNPKTAGRFIGSGAEAAVFDIGKGRVLKVRPEFDEVEGARRRENIRRVEQALGPYGNPAVAEESYSNQVGALSLEVFKKMKPHESGLESSQRIARHIYEKTGVLTDFEGSGNYGQAKTGGRLKAIDSGFGIVGATKQQAEEHFSQQSVTPSEQVRDQKLFDEALKKELIEHRAKPRTLSGELSRLGQLSGMIPPDMDPREMQQWALDSLERHPLTQQESDASKVMGVSRARDRGIKYTVPGQIEYVRIPVRKQLGPGETDPDLSAMAAPAMASIWSSQYQPTVPQPPKVDIGSAFRPSSLGPASPQEVSEAFRRMAAGYEYSEFQRVQMPGFMHPSVREARESVQQVGISREVLKKLVEGGVGIHLKAPKDVYPEVPSNMMGVFNEDTRQIHVRPDQDAMTLLHELGHAVQNVTGFTGNFDQPRNLTRVIDPSLYHPAGLARERFAQSFANMYTPGLSSYNTLRGQAEMRALTMGSGEFETETVAERQRQRLLESRSASQRLLKSAQPPLRKELKRSLEEEAFGYKTAYLERGEVSPFYNSISTFDKDIQKILTQRSLGSKIAPGGSLSLMASRAVLDMSQGAGQEYALSGMAPHSWRDMVPGAEGHVGSPNVVQEPRPGETWYHGRRGPISFEEGRPAFFTRDRQAAEWYSRERGPTSDVPTVGNFSLDIKRVAHLRDLLSVVDQVGATPRDIARHSPYGESENPADFLYVPKVRRALAARKFDGYVGSDTLENTDIDIAVPLHARQIFSNNLSGMIPPNARPRDTKTGRFMATRSDGEATEMNVGERIIYEARKQANQQEAARRAAQAERDRIIGRMPGSFGFSGTVPMSGIKPQEDEDRQSYSASTGRGARGMPYSFSGTGTGGFGAPPPRPPGGGLFGRGGGAGATPPGQPPFNPQAPTPPPGGMVPPLPTPPGGGGILSRFGGSGSTGYAAAEILAYGAAIRGLTVHLVEYAARTQTMEIVTRQMAKANSLNTDSVLAEVEAVKRYNITTQAAHTVVQRLMMAQLDVTKAPQLAEVAQNISAISGMPAPEAMEKMVVGITSGYTRSLHQMGLQVSQLSMIHKLTAERRAEGLTGPPSEYEKRAALLNDVIVAGASAMGSFEKSLMTAGGQFTLLSKDAQETTNIIGREFLPTYGRFISTIDSGLLLVQNHAEGVHTVLTGLVSVFTALAANRALSLVGSLAAGSLRGGIPGLLATGAIAAGTYYVLNQDPLEAQAKTSAEIQKRMQGQVARLKAEREQLNAMPDHTGQEWKTSWDANTAALQSMASAQVDVQHSLTEQVAAEYNKRLNDFEKYRSDIEAAQKGGPLDQFGAQDQKPPGVSWPKFLLHKLGPFGADRDSFGKPEVPDVKGTSKSQVVQEAETQRKNEERLKLMSPHLINKERLETQKLVAEMTEADIKLTKLDEQYAEGGAKYKKAGEAFLTPRQKIQYDADEEVKGTERLIKKIKDLREATDPKSKQQIADLNKSFGRDGVESFLKRAPEITGQIRADEATQLAGLSRQTAGQIAQIREQTDLERVRSSVVKGSYESEAQAIQKEYDVRAATSRKILALTGDSDTYKKSIVQAQVERDVSQMRLDQQQRDTRAKKVEDSARDAGQFYRTQTLAAPNQDYRSALLEGFQQEMSATKSILNTQERINEQTNITIRLRNDLVKLAQDEAKARAEGQVQRMQDDVALQDEVDRVINRQRRSGEPDPYGDIGRTRDRARQLAIGQYQLLQPVTPADQQAALAEQRDIQLHSADTRYLGENVKQREQDVEVAKSSAIQALELSSTGEQRINEMRAFGFAEEQAAATNNFNLRMEFIKREQEFRGTGLDAEKQTRKEVMDAEFQLLERELAARRKSQEEQRQFAGGLFDALTSHGQTSVGQFMAEQFKGINRTIFQNLFHATMGDSWLGLGKIFKGQEKTDAKGNVTPTFLGKLLSGTPFGVTHTEDIARLQADVTSRNTEAEVELTQAILALKDSVDAAQSGQPVSGGSAKTQDVLQGIGITGPVGTPSAQVQPGSVAAGVIGAVAGVAQVGMQGSAASGGPAPPDTVQGDEDLGYGPGAFSSVGELSGMPSMRLGPTAMLGALGSQAAGSQGNAYSDTVGYDSTGEGPSREPPVSSPPVSNRGVSAVPGISPFIGRISHLGNFGAAPRSPSASIFQQVAGMALGGSLLGSQFLMSGGTNDPSSVPSYSSHTPGHTVGGVAVPHGQSNRGRMMASIGMVAGSVALSEWANYLANRKPKITPKVAASMGLTLPSSGTSMFNATHGGDEPAMMPAMRQPDDADFVRLGSAPGLVSPSTPIDPQGRPLPYWTSHHYVESRPHHGDSPLMPNPGILPVFPGDTNRGTGVNTGYQLTRLDSGLIQRDSLVGVPKPMVQSRVTSYGPSQDYAPATFGMAGQFGGLPGAPSYSSLDSGQVAGLMNSDGGTAGMLLGQQTLPGITSDSFSGQDSSGSLPGLEGQTGTAGQLMSQQTLPNLTSKPGFFSNLKSAQGKVNAAAAVLAGTTQAISGFKRGGVRGDLGGAAGILTAATPFTGPAAPFVMAGAMALDLISSLLPDPKVQRQHDIAKWMNQNKYVPPVTVENIDQTMSGSAARDTLGGKVEDSGVGIFPLNVTQNQYRAALDKSGAVSNSTHSYDPYTYIPGSASLNQDNRSGPQITIHAPVNVSTMDSRSFMDNSGMITDAVHKELLAGNGISQTLQNSIFGQG